MENRTPSKNSTSSTPDYDEHFTNIDASTNLDNGRLEGGECVVPPSLSYEGAQLGGGFIRDVIPQPVDGESPSAVCHNQRNLTEIRPCLSLTLTEDDPGSADVPSAAVGDGRLCVTQASTFSLNNTEQSNDAHYVTAISTNVPPGQSDGRTCNIRQNNNAGILQWNVNGAHERYPELQLIVNEHQPAIIAVQETRVSRTTVFQKFHHGEYDWSIRLGPRSSSQNGVGLAVHKNSSYKFLSLRTPLQVVAAQVMYPVAATYASIYIPCHTPPQMLQEELQKLIDELPRPIMLLGDFNCHSPMWEVRKGMRMGPL